MSEKVTALNTTPRLHGIRIHLSKTMSSTRTKHASKGKLISDSKEYIFIFYVYHLKPCINSNEQAKNKIINSKHKHWQTSQYPELPNQIRKFTAYHHSKHIKKGNKQRKQISYIFTRNKEINYQNRHLKRKMIQKKKHSLVKTSNKQYICNRVTA